MNATLIEAMKAPAVLEKRERGKEVLIRTALIQFYMGTCDAIDKALAQLPALLKKHGLAEYDNEPLQRSMLSDGFAAVQVAVKNRTLDRLEKSGLFPKVRERFANENTDAIPQGLRDELEATVREINVLNKELDLPVDFGALWFKSGKLRIPPKYRAEIEPRYTIEVSSKQRKAVEKFRKAEEAIAELKAEYPNLRYSDYPFHSPDGRTYINSGIISSLANGYKYTDAELLGLFQDNTPTH